MGKDFPEALPISALRRCCDPNDIPFATTDQAEPLAAPPGQQRALEALAFGLGMSQPGYNLYLGGSAGLGKRRLAEQRIGELAAAQPPADDWCYVSRFSDPQRPQALCLPAGRGASLRDAVDALLRELLAALPAAFAGAAYRARVQTIQQALEKRRQTALDALAEEARSGEVLLINEQNAFRLVPMLDGEAMSDSDYTALNKTRKRSVDRRVERLSKKLNALLRELPGWQREADAELHTLNAAQTEQVLGPLLERVRGEFGEQPAVLDWLGTLRDALLRDTDRFLPDDEQSGMPSDTLPASLMRYRVNLLMQRDDSPGAPVVYLDNPGYQQLCGRIEFGAENGTWLTHHGLIKPGALHHANGGYLLLDAHRLLESPYSWRALKRVLRSGELQIEPIERASGLGVTPASLEPDAIPLRVKVVLLGDHWLYRSLLAGDREFGQLFKALAEFDEACPRDDAHAVEFAHYLAALARQAGSMPMNRQAVARLVDAAARMMGDREKLNLNAGELRDLIAEAGYFAARDEGAVEIEAEHVRAAQVSRRQRVSYYRESAQESLLRGRRFVETEGSVIGQVNVLGVYSAPEAAFCIPSRTTATVRLGGGRVIDVERESNLAGNIRSKGMVILSSVLIDRYAAERHLRLTVSLATEQSYRKRDGDSASLASLCASISAISGVPIKQCFAMTGSISQHGQVHPIGATNTKIEGFFDICVARGLTGEQGVIIPAANLDDLMLREDVVEACAEGKFSVYAVSTVDEALALLTGEQPGEKDKHGKYPEDSVNGKVIAAIDRWERIFHDKPPTQRPQAEQAASKAGDEKQAKSGKRKKKKKHKRRQKKAD